MKKILFNLVSSQDDGIMQPWLRILKIFQSHGCDIFVNTGKFVKKLGSVGDVYQFQWLEDKEKKILLEDRTATKFGFMLHSLRRNLLMLKKSRQVLRKNQFDVVYTPSAVLDFVIYPYYLKITGKKIAWVTTLANIVPISDEGNKVIRMLAWIFFRISLRMMRRADIIFASTPEIKVFLALHGFKNKNVITTGFAVENELIEKAAADKKYNIDALFAGRINETKGIYDMLKVLEILKKKYHGFQLAFMGDGDIKTKAAFHKKILELGLKNNICFLGFRSGIEKHEIIKSARCFWFLSNSKSESFGVALLEAVCSGVPAFAYDLPQFEWLYLNGEVDISPKGDYKMVAEKVIKLFESGNFANEEGKLLLGKYSWEKIAEIEYDAIKNL